MANEVFCIDCIHLSDRLNVAGFRQCMKWKDVDLVTGGDIYAIAKDERTPQGRCKPEALSFVPRTNPPAVPHSGSGVTKQDPGAATNRRGKK